MFQFEKTYQESCISLPTLFWFDIHISFIQTILKNTDTRSVETVDMGFDNSSKMDTFIFQFIGLSKYLYFTSPDITFPPAAHTYITSRFVTLLYLHYITSHRITSHYATLSNYQRRNASEETDETQ